MTVSSGWNSREVSLKGRLIGVTRSTPGSAPKASSNAGLRLPISPTIVRVEALQSSLRSLQNEVAEHIGPGIGVTSGFNSMDGD